MPYGGDMSRIDPLSLIVFLILVFVLLYIVRLAF